MKTFKPQSLNVDEILAKALHIVGNEFVKLEAVSVADARPIDARRFKVLVDITLDVRREQRDAAAAYAAGEPYESMTEQQLDKLVDEVIALRQARN